MWSDKVAGMVLVLVMLSKVQGWQVDGLMLRGERMFQGSREGLGLDLVQPKTQHGHNIGYGLQGVCRNGRQKVFVKFWKFLWWILFIYSERWNGGGGGQFGAGLQVFKMGVDLLFISMSPLVSFVLVNLVKVSTGGQQQSGSS